MKSFTNRLKQMQFKLFKWPRLQFKLPRWPSAELGVFLLGWVLFVVGLWAVYAPAGLIGGGAVLMAIAVFGTPKPSGGEQ